LILEVLCLKYQPFPFNFRCIRIEGALENDSDRLLSEASAYEQAIQEDEAVVKEFHQIVQRAVNSALHSIDGDEVVSSDLFQNRRKIFNVQNSVGEAFLREIESLERTCRQHRDELVHLRAVQKDYAYLLEEIDLLADSMAAEQNALELEGCAFDNDQEHLSRMLAEYQNETAKLSSPSTSLLDALIHLHVDIERGLRYPLINELRLAFRPKGDIHWKEIQAAWALASNLLLMIATVFNFQSQSWKIVPLSHCVKLIYSSSKRTEAIRCDTLIKTVPNKSTREGTHQVIVFNLGHPKTNGSKALLMWNALLCQVIQHVATKNSQAVETGIFNSVDVLPVPFDISSTSIGGISLAQLDENDDTGWSRVIHFMASNLVWLSKCASNYVSHQVVLFTPF
jgi:Apg6 BARA domain